MLFTLQHTDAPVKSEWTVKHICIFRRRECDQMIHKRITPEKKKGLCSRVRADKGRQFDTHVEACLLDPHQLQPNSTPNFRLQLFSTHHLPGLYSLL